MQVDAPSADGKVRVPIAILKTGKLGEHRIMQSNLEFPRGPVTFRLVEGDGPVHLMGQHLPPDPNVEVYEDEEEEIADEIQEVDDADQDDDVAADEDVRHFRFSA